MLRKQILKEGREAVRNREEHRESEKQRERERETALTE